MNEVYESTIPKDRGLRDIYVQVALAQGPKLFANKEFEELVDQNGQFWKDYAKGLSEQYRLKEIPCIRNTCSNTFTTSTCRGGSSTKEVYCPACGQINVAK
jgi:hypothetical protein